MKTYKFQIMETLSRIVEIEAENPDEAKQKAKAMYDNEEIVLDYNDLIGGTNIQLLTV